MVARRLAPLVAFLLPLAALAQDGLPVGFGFAYLGGTDGQPVVTAVAPDSGAEAGGLAAGDSLVTVDGQSVTGTVDGQAVLVAARDAGPTATFEVVRDGAPRTLTLGTAPYDPAVLSRLAVVFLCVSGDCLDGQGEWAAPDGERYAGAFVGGRRHGDGRLALTNGDLYVGTFRDGLLDGRGTYIWADGDLYVGEVRDGAPHGDGVRTYDDGGVYTGEFVGGSRHGTGAFRRPDGTVWTGVWVDGEGVRGTHHAADGAPVSEGPFAD